MPRTDDPRRTRRSKGIAQKDNMKNFVSSFYGNFEAH